MATLQIRKGSYRVLFCLNGKRYTYTLGKVSKREAQLAAANLDRLLLRVDQKLLSIPAGANIVQFFKNDGRVPEEETPTPLAITFSDLRGRYLAAHGNGAMETNTISTLRLHLKHIGDSIGDRFPMRELGFAEVQGHIDRRSSAKYRGQPIGAVTIRKEITTLKAVWNWGSAAGLVSGLFPSRGLAFPKTDEKPPFLTLKEAERKIAVGGLTAAERSSLYQALYLRKEEIAELLEHVQSTAIQPWVYPLICTAAHTGARRSELLRIEVADVDLAAATVMIREKKRSKKQRTTRSVSLTPLLKTALADWIAMHPGGRFLFCQAGTVAKSKKRSRTTGHQSGASRSKSLAGRKATVTLRDLTEVAVVTKDEAHDHFKRTLAGSKWAVLRGFHILRHSFISCLAAAEVDQRIIDEFVGHQTDEQRKRYRHLIPEVKHKAIAGAFG